MRIPYRIALAFTGLSLFGMLATAAAPAATPAGWKTVTNDTKTCKLSLPPEWKESPPDSGMFDGPEAGEMVMFIEDEETAKAGNLDPIRAEIARKKAAGTKVEVLEDTPTSIIFQSPRGSLLAVLAFRRSPKTLCVVQIAVPAADPAVQKVARQIADSLTPAP